MHSLASDVTRVICVPALLHASGPATRLCLHKCDHEALQSRTSRLRTSTAPAARSPCIAPETLVDARRIAADELDAAGAADAADEAGAGALVEMGAERDIEPEAEVALQLPAELEAELEDDDKRVSVWIVNTWVDEDVDGPAVPVPVPGETAEVGGSGGDVWIVKTGADGALELPPGTPGTSWAVVGRATTGDQRGVLRGGADSPGAL
jgi:hypothetical protein